MQLIKISYTNAVCMMRASSGPDAKRTLRNLGRCVRIFRLFSEQQRMNLYYRHVKCALDCINTLVIWEMGASPLDFTSRRYTIETDVTIGSQDMLLPSLLYRVYDITAAVQSNTPL